jgi:osmotically inducible lipoprotein OsmB
MRRLIVPVAVILSASALAACGQTIEQRAATGAVAGAVVAGPVGAAVGGAAGAAVGQATKPE